METMTLTLIPSDVLNDPRSRLWRGVVTHPDGRTEVAVALISDLEFGGPAAPPPPDWPADIKIRKGKLVQWSTPSLVDRQFS